MTYLVQEALEIDSSDHSFERVATLAGGNDHAITGSKRSRGHRLKFATVPRSIKIVEQEAA